MRRERDLNLGWSDSTVLDQCGGAERPLAQSLMRGLDQFIFGTFECGQNAWVTLIGLDLCIF
jgi:hypothetical protein